MKNKFQKKVTVYVFLFCTGCAGTNPNLMIDYDSKIGNPFLIPAEANLEIEFNDEFVPDDILTSTAKYNLHNTIEADLFTNLFRDKENSIDVIISFDSLLYIGKGQIGQIVSTIGEGLIILGPLSEDPAKAEARSAAGALIFFISLFMPQTEYTALSKISLEIRDNGESISRIEAEGTASEKEWFTQTWLQWLYEKSANSHQARRRRLYSDAIKYSVEAAKSQILLDAQNLSAAINQQSSPRMAILRPTIRASSSGPKIKLGATMAILDFEGIGISRQESLVLTNRLGTHLVNSGGFQVIERSQIQDVLREQEFQLTGCTSNECAVEIGQILGCEYMLAGSYGKFGSLYTIDMRIIDVQTGKIVRTSSSDVEGNLEQLLTIGLVQAAQSILGSE